MLHHTAFGCKKNFKVKIKVKTKAKNFDLVKFVCKLKCTQRIYL